MIAPIFEKMAEEFQDVLFLKVDVDAANDVAGFCGIEAMPTFQAFKGGQKIAEIKGADQTKLRSLVVDNM